MKLGTENKKKTIIAGGLLVHGGRSAGACVLRRRRGNRACAAAAAPVPQQRRRRTSKPARTLLAHSLDPTLRFDLLKSSEDVTYKGNGRNIFRSRRRLRRCLFRSRSNPEIARLRRRRHHRRHGLKFYGYAGPKNGGKKVFLFKGEDIFLAKEGDDRRPSLQDHCTSERTRSKSRMC